MPPGAGRDVATRGRHNLAHLPAGLDITPYNLVDYGAATGPAGATTTNGTVPGRVWVGAPVPGHVAMDLA